jgi:6-phosphogluconolactonase
MGNLAVHVHDDTEKLFEEVAHFLVHCIQESIEARGRCRLALAGGRTPRRLYRRLARKDLREKIRWRSVELFWGDERCVPLDNRESNFHMVWVSLIQPLGLSLNRVHPIDGHLDPDLAAEIYAETLGEQPLDLVLLGMGEDGHTASLFPYTPDLLAEQRRVIATESTFSPIERVSLSLRALNEARSVAFLVTGRGKARRVAQVIRQLEQGTPTLPAAMVQPSSGDLHWFVDRAAAAELEAEVTEW